MVEIDLHTGQRFISFLGAGIGLVPDVDIGSESLRFMGYMRAYILVLYKIIKPKYYHAQVSYLPLDKKTDSGNL